MIELQIPGRCLFERDTADVVGGGGLLRAMCRSRRGRFRRRARPRTSCVQGRSQGATSQFFEAKLLPAAGAEVERARPADDHDESEVAKEVRNKFLFSLCCSSITMIVCVMKTACWTHERRNGCVVACAGDAELVAERGLLSGRLARPLRDSDLMSGFALKIEPRTDSSGHPSQGQSPDLARSNRLALISKSGDGGLAVSGGSWFP